MMQTTFRSKETLNFYVKRPDNHTLDANLYYVIRCWDSIVTEGLRCVTCVKVHICLNAAKSVPYSRSFALKDEAGNLVGVAVNTDAFAEPETIKTNNQPQTVDNYDEAIRPLKYIWELLELIEAPIM